MDDIPPLVKVVWLDSGAHIDMGWSKARTNWEAGLSREVTTVGLLMQEDEEVVAVGLNFDPSTGNWYSVQLIYRPTIQSITHLQEVLQ